MSRRQTKDKAGRRAFERVLETFFGGSLEEALAAHLHSRKDQVSADERRAADCADRAGTAGGPLR